MICCKEKEEPSEVYRVLSLISNMLLNGTDLILDRVGFNRIEDSMFCKLVKARLSCPAGKTATVEYLKNHFDDDVDLFKIYRYLNKPSDRQHGLVQDISVRHTARLFGSNIGVLSYMKATNMEAMPCCRPSMGLSENITPWILWSWQIPV